MASSLRAWVVGAGIVAGLSALGDIAPPARLECKDKKAGDLCRGGVCTESMCSRPDYSKGLPPTTKRVPCLECKPAPAPDGGR